MVEPYFEVVVLKNGRWIPCDERCSKFKTEAEAEEVMDELIDRGILANIVESEVTARMLDELRS